MRCTLISTGLGRGGAETQLVQLALALKQRGWSVQVLSMLGGGDLQPFLEDIPVECLGFSRGRPLPSGFVRAFTVIRRHQPTVLVSFTFPANLLGRAVGRLAQVPVVVSSIRGERFGGWLRERLMRLTGWMDTMTTTNSEKVAESLIARRIVAAKKIKVIYNGVDMRRVASTTRSTAAIREELDVLESEFLWLAVGRLEEPKAYPILLDAFSRLNRGTAARLLIAGEGPLRVPLTDKIRERGLTEVVSLLGPRSDVPDLLAAADALVLSSAHEGMPNSVMEALAAGLPVVATDVGGIRELVHDRRSGFIVPPGDPVRLSEGMQQMMALPREQRKRMGVTGQAYVAQRFDTEAVANEWERLVLQLVDGRA